MFNDLTDQGFHNEAQKFCKDTTKPSEVIRHYNNEGVKLSKSGDFAGAIREYERALVFFPTYKENYRIYFNLALAHLKFPDQEHKLAAEENLEKCLQLDPNFEKAQRKLKELSTNLKAG